MIAKILLFISIILFDSVNAQRCFTNSDIINSNILFTYKGGVYDITDYNHPAGMKTLKETVGKPLEDFVNLPRYDFHLTSNSFKNDMKKMYTGVLKDNCNQTSEETTQTETTETTETTQIETTQIETTQIPTEQVTTTSQITTSQSITTIVTSTAEYINCLLFNFILKLPYTRQNIISEINESNVSQNDTSLILSLTPDIGGSRISTTNYIQYGQIEATIKPSKGVNVITSFYIEADNGDMVNFNIIQNKERDNSIIETNFYKGNISYNLNSKYYETSIILYDTFNKYSIIWFPTYYEWRLNDILLRRVNKLDINNFPNSPSKVKFSIWEAGPSVLAGPGIEWDKSPFNTELLSLNIYCNNTYTPTENPNNKNIPTKNSDNLNPTKNTPNNSELLKNNFTMYILSIIVIIIIEF
jgi:beta-glucanase (GH16 family)